MTTTSIKIPGDDRDEIPMQGDLPPEVHLRMALDYLQIRAKRLGLPLTALLIGTACEACLQEMDGGDAMALPNEEN